MPGPNEMQLNLINGVEYITLCADDFRTAMRERDALRAENERLEEENNERAGLLHTMTERLAQRDATIAEYGHATTALRDENERLLALNQRLREGGFAEAEKAEELAARLAESEAENDQWQKKLTEVWTEVADLRGQVALLHAALRDTREKVVGVNPIGRANVIRLGDALNLIDEALSPSLTD